MTLTVCREIFDSHESDADKVSRIIFELEHGDDGRNNEYKFAGSISTILYSVFKEKFEHTINYSDDLVKVFSEEFANNLLKMGYLKEIPKNIPYVYINQYISDIGLKRLLSEELEKEIKEKGTDFLQIIKALNDDMMECIKK